MLRPWLVVWWLLCEGQSLRACSASALNVRSTTRASPAASPWRCMQHCPFVLSFTAGLGDPDNLFTDTMTSILRQTNVQMTSCYVVFVPAGLISYAGINPRLKLLTSASADYYISLS